LVRKTLDFELAAIFSITDVELTDVTILDAGCFFRIYCDKSNADLSPVRIFPVSSQKILLSPSPSNAIPRSAFDFIIMSDRLFKF